VGFADVDDVDLRAREELVGLRSREGVDHPSTITTKPDASRRKSEDLETTVSAS
jgi:hypothetical protein